MAGSTRRSRAAAGASAGGFCCLLLLQLAPAAPVRAQEPPGIWEEGFFDIALQRVGRRIGVTVLVDSTGRVLVPLRDVIEHAGIVATWTPDSAVLEWPPETWRTVVHHAEGRVERGATTVPLAAGDWVHAGPDVFMGAEALAAVLGSGVDIVFADLTVLLEPNPQFPAIRRADIELRRSFDRGAADGFPLPAGADVAYPPRNGGFVASWGLSFVDSRGHQRSALRLAAGGSAWGGGFEAGGTLGFGNRSATTVDGRFVRWTRGFPADPWIRQFQAGTIFSDGPAGRRLIGMSLTNAPFTTPRLFGEAVIEPAVPAGWEYEVYQGDYLVGVGSREAPGGIRTPLNYGNTPVRVRLIGPSGQEVTQDLAFVVRPAMVPAGAWRYWLGLGQCADDGCEDYVWGELRHGFSPRLTAALGLDRITPAGEARRWRPYMLATGTPLPNLGAEIQYQPGALLRSAFQLQAGQAGSLAGSYAWFEPTGPVDVLAGWNAQLNASVRLPFLGGRYLGSRVLLRGVERGRVDLWQAGLSTSIRRVFASLDYEAGLQDRDLLTARAFATWPAAGRLPLRDLAVSAAFGASRLGADLLEIGASARPLPRATVNASVRFRRGAPPAFILGMTTRFDGGFGQARTARTSAGSDVFLSADGGIARDPAVGTMLLPFESLGRAGIAGIVFEDLNGDGVRGSDEPGLAGAVVGVGPTRVTAGSDGAYRAWLLQPFEALPVVLDSLSIPFDRAALHPVELVRPSPNLFTRLDIPVIRTREVSGTVSAPADVTVGGIGIEILDGDGVLVASVRTYRDGEFYIPRLRPGAWRARVAAASLGALGAVADPSHGVGFVVTVAGDEPVLVPPLRLSRR